MNDNRGETVEVDLNDLVDRFSAALTKTAQERDEALRLVYDLRAELDEWIMKSSNQSVAIRDLMATRDRMHEVIKQIGKIACPYTPHESAP